MEITTTEITYRSNGRMIPGYLAQPVQKGEYPAVVVIQEWWGLVPHIKRVVERFAQAGFMAVAPDLYHGQAATEPDEARKLAMSLDRARAVAEIAAAARYLGNEQYKVGVVGWCMGGGLSLSAAAEYPNWFGATVCFYGRPLDERDTERLEVPALCLYAEHDHAIPLTQVQAFADRLAQSPLPHQVHIYPNTQHAFFNDTRSVYQPEAASDAWQKMIAWFHRFLPLTSPLL